MTRIYNKIYNEWVWRENRNDNGCRLLDISGHISGKFPGRCSIFSSLKATQIEYNRRKISIASGRKQNSFLKQAL